MPNRIMSNKIMSNKIATFQLMKVNLHLVGHLLRKHFLCWSEFPLQPRPPFWGLGLVHVRVLFCTPLPQDFEQLDHLDHLDHPPFTLFVGGFGLVVPPVWLEEDFQQIKSNQIKSNQIVFFWNMITFRDINNQQPPVWLEEEFQQIKSS